MPAIDQGKLDRFVGRMLQDLGGAMLVPLVLIGDRLGFYKAMSDGRPILPAELASRTGTAERYVREWLSANAAAGYVEYDPAAGRFCLPAEQAAVFADEHSPVCMLGAFDVAEAGVRDYETVLAAFKSGKGVGWHEHSPCLFRGTERFFRPGYEANLVDRWLPALEGVVDKLQRGARVADVGCGHGWSTILMARAFPRSQFVGFDYHEPSIARARELARDAGVAGKLRFERGAAKDFPGTGYDLVTFFDCLHDMGDPAGAAAHVCQALDRDGTWMIVEPFAHDRLEDNLNPVGQLYYAASTVICTPASLSQEVGLGLGAQAGEARLKQVVTSGGFTRFRRATETPFNIVLEARP